MKLLKHICLTIACTALLTSNLPAQEKDKPESKPPDKAAKPAEKTKPAEETKPAAEPKPAEKAKPAEEVKPAEKAKPAQEPKPAEKAKPAQEPIPAEKAEPAQEPKPAEKPEPAQEPKPAEKPPVKVAPKPAPKPEPMAPPPPALAAIVVGARLGVFMPQVSSELSTHVIATLEGGYILPYLEGRLQLFGTLAYTQPENSENRQDPRLTDAGGEYTFTTIQREFTIEAGLLARLLPIEAPFNGYASFAPRLYFLETETYGKAGGEKFGTNYEQSTKFGFSFALGGEMLLGPGRIHLQLAFAYSQLQHIFTGNVPTGAMIIAAGYRYMF